MTRDTTRVRDTPVRDDAGETRRLVEAFRAMTDVVSVSCVVADAQQRAQVMHSSLRLRSVTHAFIGTAVTVGLSPGNLVDPLAVLDVVSPGDVVVVDAFGESETSVWGGLMCGLARSRGVAGVVVDGSARDIDEARLLEFPIVSRSVSPRSTHSPVTGRYEPVALNTPVHCGGVIVRPGDLVVADEIGVTVVRQEDLAEVHERAVTQAELESSTRRDILAGLSYADLLAKYGRI
ncbi:RraA family protein [Cellulosimicrobium cellulans]|uniref:RraA family protein n=1 Tax=Cellulosimicrobium cellulans TaxID=1710 RepID=UPI00130D95F9|nr:RraA family protein [Cellulosimicrobium cellulans]